MNTETSTPQPTLNFNPKSVSIARASLDSEVRDLASDLFILHGMRKELAHKLIAAELRALADKLDPR